MSPGKSWDFWVFQATPCFRIYLSHVDLAEIDNFDTILKWWDPADAAEVFYSNELGQQKYISIVIMQIQGH